MNLSKRGGQKKRGKRGNWKDTRAILDFTWKVCFNALVRLQFLNDGIMDNQNKLQKKISK